MNSENPKKRDGGKFNHFLSFLRYKLQKNFFTFHFTKTQTFQMQNKNYPHFQKHGYIRISYLILWRGLHFKIRFYRFNRLNLIFSFVLLSTIYKSLFSNNFLSKCGHQLLLVGKFGSLYQLQKIVKCLYIST